MRLVSVNAFNLYDGDAPAARERFARLEELVRGLDADVLAVQEIVAREPGPRDPDKRDLATTRLRRLAKAVDRQWKLDGEPVLALGGGIHHTALLWRDGITPVPGTLGRFERDGAGMWHSMVTCVFDVGGPRLRVGSVQLSPFDQAWGWSDAAQILRAMHGDDVPGFIGGDFNGIGATTVPTLDGGEHDYDYDPYLRQPWHPDHVYQVDEHGRLDRRVAIRLERLGRMRDCARIAGAGWAATTGFHSADNHPPRRIDRWYATHHAPDAAVRGVEVVDHATVGHCTDHAPVILDIDPGALTR